IGQRIAETDGNATLTRSDASVETGTDNRNAIPTNTGVRRRISRIPAKSASGGGLENGGLRNILLENLQRLIDRPDAPASFFVRRQFRGAKRLMEFPQPEYAVGSDSHGNRKQARNTHRRNSRPFQLLRQRSPATRARSSGGGEE